MRTELHTQIRAYGAQLMDDQPPITEAEVLALVASVREFSVVERPARAKPRPWIAVAAAAVTLVVGGLIAWLVAQSDPDATPADTIIVSTTSPEVTTTSPEDCRDCDPVETPVGLIPLDDLDDDVLRPLDQIRNGDIIVPTAPTGWALDPEVYIDPDQSAFVVTVWNHNASRGYEIWAAPACEPAATHCPVFSYGSISWPLTDPGVFSSFHSSGVTGDDPYLAAVIGDHVVVVAPAKWYGSQRTPAGESVWELVASLRAVAPDELPLQVTATARGISPDPAAVEAALAPFQPLDEVHVMTPGSGGPLPRWKLGLFHDGDVEVVESRHIIGLDDPYGPLDAWTYMRVPVGRDGGPQCVLIMGALASGEPIVEQWCEGVNPSAAPWPSGPFGHDSSGGDPVLLHLSGGPDTIAFIVEEEDGPRVGLVAVSGLAYYRNGALARCWLRFDLTAIEADGTTHTGYESFRC